MDGLAEVQHLLRHLNDLPGLRKNALVAGLFERDEGNDPELHGHLRRIVLTAVDNLANQHGDDNPTDAARWQSIVRRCDLQGELHRNVASDLGLGSRQFYRVRRRMHEVLLKSLVREFEHLSRPTSEVQPPSEVALELTRGMRDYGRVQEAVKILREIATSAPEPGQRLSAIAELTDIYSELEPIEHIVPLIESAHTLCYGPSGTGDPLHEAEVHYAESSLALSRSNFGDRVDALSRMYIRALAAGPSHRSHELRLRATLNLAETYLMLGQYVKAEQQCTTAFAHLNTLIGFDRARAGASLIRAALCHRDAFREGLSRFGDALTAARNAGAPMLSAEASLGAAALYMAGEDFNTARLHARNGLLFADAAGHAGESAYAMGTLARIELEAGHPHKALDMLQKARKEHHHYSIWRYIGDSLFAVSLARTNRAETAVTLIDESCGAMRHAGAFRHLARAEVHRAEVYATAGRKAEARKIIGEAVSLTESHGSQTGLAQAYRVSATLTGNAQHRAIAAELKSEFVAAIA